MSAGKHIPLFRGASHLEMDPWKSEISGAGHVAVLGPPIT
jgi:hypothetical protein